MKTNEVKLAPGDMFYYEPSQAIAILISREVKDDVVLWTYALRSPSREDRSRILVSVTQDPEAGFITSLQSGRFGYYSTGGER